MKKYIIALCIMLLFLSGCGKKDESIENYRAGMEEILSGIADINNEINSLNPDDENSMNALMISLDKLDGEFKKMTELEYPEGFDQIKKLAFDASSDMSASVSRFHDAYDGEYNEVAQSEAYDLYQDANQKLRVLIQVLRGEYNNNSEEENTEINQIEESSNDLMTIEIIAGETGEYGQELTLNENTEFEDKTVGYFIPSGTYKVTNIGEYPTQVNVYLNSKNTTEEGWEEWADGFSETIEINESKEITLEEGYFLNADSPSHLSLSKLN